MTMSLCISLISACISLASASFTGYSLYRQRIKLNIEYDKDNTFNLPDFHITKSQVLTTYLSISNPYNSSVTISKITLHDGEKEYVALKTYNNLNSDIAYFINSLNNEIIIPVVSQSLFSNSRISNYDCIDGYVLFKDIPLLNEGEEKTYTLIVHTANKKFSILIKSSNIDEKINPLT